MMSTMINMMTMGVMINMMMNNIIKMSVKITKW